MKREISPFNCDVEEENRALPRERRERGEEAFTAGLLFHGSRGGGGAHGGGVCVCDTHTVNAFIFSDALPPQRVVHTATDTTVTSQVFSAGVGL